MTNSIDGNEPKLSDPAKSINKMTNVNQTETSGITLLPCPFCGEQDINVKNLSQQYLTIEPRSPEGLLNVCMDGCGWYWVQCSSCEGVNGPKVKGPLRHDRNADKTRAAIKKAVTAWNKRAGR